MELSKNISTMRKTRDELSWRNFRRSILPFALVFLLSIVIGDLRHLDQQLTVFGIESTVLMKMAFGLGFLPLFFSKERHVHLLLRVSVLAQAALLTAQLLLDAGIPRVGAYCAFHFACGVSTSCGLYLFVFSLNNVERFFTMVSAQTYYAFSYLFFQLSAVADFFRGAGSAAVMLALIAVVFLIRQDSWPKIEMQKEPGVKESGIAAVIALSMIYHIITLMTFYIAYQEQTISQTLYGIGGLAAIAVMFTVMFFFNYSALHLWSLCLVCTVLGIGALHYNTSFAVNGGSFFYGIGEGLGFMILFYIQGGALKRSGSFKLLRLCCLFNCVNYAVVNSVFFIFYDHLDASNLTIAFPVVLVLEIVCLLLAPILHDRLFRTDWTDGFHMVDMPVYAEALQQVEQVDVKNTLGLTPREKEVFMLLQTEASFKQIAGTLGLSDNTVRFHSKNLYRKLNIQSRAELMAQYGPGKLPPVQKV